VRTFSHEDLFRDDLQKRSSCDSAHVGCHFLKSKQVVRRFLPMFSGSVPRFSGILWRLSQILPRSRRIFPGFSPSQNFWGCACTPCTPASYITDYYKYNGDVSTPKNFLKTCVSSSSQIHNYCVLLRQFVYKKKRNV